MTSCCVSVTLIKVEIGDYRHLMPNLNHRRRAHRSLQGGGCLSSHIENGCFKQFFISVLSAPCTSWYETWVCQNCDSSNVWSWWVKLPPKFSGQVGSCKYVRAGWVDVDQNNFGHIVATANGLWFPVLFGSLLGGGYNISVRSFPYRFCCSQNLQA